MVHPGHDIRDTVPFVWCTKIRAPGRMSGQSIRPRVAQYHANKVLGKRRERLSPSDLN
jgi:hypothetical protein